MDLANEDSLRLNVLLHQDVHAIRIDDSKMVVHALSPQGEVSVALNPNCRDEQYVKKVKEMISSHILGSPGGYPIFLRRWTRMGQARDGSLERLLKLGEPEAVVAVVNAEGLTDELARRAWWVMPDAANARCMLAREKVVKGKMGKVLAEFLLEFLPFEEDPRDLIESVRLVLQPGLIDETEKNRLWARGQRKNVFYVGFLKTLPDDLPLQLPPHPQYEYYRQKLAALPAPGNVVGGQLLRILSPAGQAFVETVMTVMKKPANQDVVIALLQAIESYFSGMLPGAAGLQEMHDIIEYANRCCAEESLEEFQQVLKIVPQAKPMLTAMLILSRVGEHVVNSIFSRTDAVGTVMRRKLEPVSQPLMEQLAILGGKQK